MLRYNGSLSGSRKAPGPPTPTWIRVSKASLELMRGLIAASEQVPKTFSNLDVQ